jgi:hypothetical protein
MKTTVVTEVATGDVIKITATTDHTTREAHIAEYLADHPVAARGNGMLIRDAIEHGWAGGNAHAAELVREFVEEAVYRTDTLRLAFDWRERLEELAASLESEIGA